ncbi:MAG: hypothetical protein GY757_31420 [bacterium]|nr:hypothetical protein [bacterium]
MDISGIASNTAMMAGMQPGGQQFQPLKPLMDTVPEDQRESVREQLGSLNRSQRGELKQRLDELKPLSADMTHEEIGSSFMSILSEVASSSSGENTQGSGNQTGMMMHPPPQMNLMNVLDSDGDHQLGATELENASEALLALDGNGDGTLTAEELRPKGPPKEGHRPPPPPPRNEDQEGKPPASPLLSALDTDEDGQISATEIENASSTLSALDLNGDGIISPDELRPQGEDEINENGS